MSRERALLIDAMIRELYRQSAQAERNQFFVTKSDDHATLHVMGLLDLDKLARAIEDA